MFPWYSSRIYSSFSKGDTGRGKAMDMEVVDESD